MADPTTGATRWLLAVTLGVSVSCGDDDASRPSPPAVEASAAVVDDWSERLREPSTDDVLAALAQSHAQVRPHVGPHALTTTADFSLVPPEAPPGSPALDRPVVEAQQLHDALTLTWASADEDRPRWSLSQANDHDRGRDVVVIDQTVHVRKAHREWFHYPRDSELAERWLDDAQRSVHDVVQLAAPRLALRSTAREGAGLDGGLALEITLQLAPEVTAERTAAGPTQGWRRDAQIHAIDGTIRLDATSGAWLDADLNVSFRVVGADGRTLEGQVHLTGQVAPGAAQVAAPEGSTPVPSRLRYDDEQRQLLDGLAAP